MKTGNKLLALTLLLFTVFSFAPVNAQVKYSEEKDFQTNNTLNKSLRQQPDMTYEGRIGPGYGRFHSVAFDPQNEGDVYAANYTRQLFKSTDAGQTWEYIYSAPQVVGNMANIENLKFANPNEPSHLYFTVTDGLSNDVATRGLYIYDVANNEVVDVIQVFYIQHLNFSDYDVDPENPDNIVVFGSMGVWFTGSKKTVWRSTDGGENFDLIYDYLNYDELAPKTVNIYPGDPDRILIGLGASPNDDEGGFFGTVDGGQTWNRLLSGDIIGEVEMVPGNPQTLFAVTGFGAETEKILRSVDGGMTWAEMDITLTPEQLDCFVSLGIDPTNPDNVWATEENEIVVTHDGGETWESIVFEQSTYHTYYYGVTVAVNPFNSHHVIIGGDHRVVETLDNGANWDVKPVKTLSITSLDATKFPNDSVWLYYTANGSYFAESMQSGERNEQLGLNMVGLTYYIHGDEYTQDRSFMGVPGGFMGGITLFQSETHWAGPPTEVFSDNGVKVLTHIRRAPEDEDIYWMVMPKWNPGSVAEFFRTMDGFETTENISITGTEEKIKDLEVVEGQPGVLWAYAIGENKAGVYKSTDYGDNWTSLSSGLPDGAGIWDLAVNPNDPDQVVASVSLGNGLYVTNDGGQSWNPAFTDYECMDVYFSGHEDVIIAQRFVQAGLVISLDGGETWSEASILDANYTDMDIIDHNETIDIYLSGMGVCNVKYTLTPDPSVVQLLPPTDLTAEVMSDEVVLDWTSPVPSTEWLHFDNGENFDGIGLDDGGSFTAAIRWDEDMIGPYDGQVIEALRIFPRSLGNAELVLKIWKGENASTLLHEQTVENPEEDAWNQIELDTPVVIEGSQWLWIGYDVLNHDPGNYPAGVDVGPAVQGYGDMVMLDGSWATLSSYGLDFNWNIQAMVVDNGMEMLATPGHPVKVKTNQGSTRLVAGNLPQAPQPAITDNETLEGYNVYRDGVKINETILDMTTYTDATVISGDYLYYVTAVYTEGESEASNILEVYVEGNNGKILGFIRDASTNLGLNNATITAIGTDNGVLSKITPFGSHYSMEIPGGTYDVTCVVEGYEPETITGLAVTQGTNTGYTFYLVPQTDRSFKNGTIAKNNVGVYPNPSAGQITISGNDLQEVIISTIEGQAVFSSKVDASETLRIDNLRSGMYMVTIITASGDKINQKLIVK